MLERLESEHIVLRKARLADVVMIYENYYSDQVVASTMLWKPEDSLESAMQRVKRTIDYQNQHDVFYVAIKQTDEPIGMAGIFQKEENVYEDTGIGIGRKYQKNGYGKEIWALLLKLAFENRNAEKFIYGSFKENVVSIALAKHFGFEYEDCYQITRYDGITFEVNQSQLSKEKYFTWRKKHD